MTVEKDTGSHHSPNHTIKKKLRICLNPRDLNEVLEREPYHTHSVDEITAKLQGMTVFTNWKMSCATTVPIGSHVHWNLPNGSTIQVSFLNLDEVIPFSSLS